MMNTITIDAQALGHEPGQGTAAAGTRDAVALQVRGGLHDGAEATLGAGSYLIGRAAHCDFVLHDAEVAEEHLLLNVSPSGALVRALADGVRHDGTRLPTNTQFALDQPGWVRVGPVWVGLRYANAPAEWPDLPGEGRTATRHPLVGKARALVVRRPVLSALLGVLLLLGAIGLAVSAVRDGWLRGVADTRLDEARQRVASLALREVQVEQSPTGETLLSGYVPDLGALRRMRQAFGPSGARFSVYSADELVRFAREWMAGRGYQVTAAYAGLGHVELTGAETGKPGFELAANQLVQEVPGLAGVRSTITPLAAQATPAPVAPKADDPFVLAGVSGVNAGATLPYLTAGSTYIFRGGALKNGMTVVDIEPERVLVDDHGVTSTQEVRIR
jgi:type III secretion system YscD/HrpQ family protein